MANNTGSSGENPFVLAIAAILLGGAVLSRLTAAPIIAWLVEHHVLVPAAPIPIPGAGGAGLDPVRALMALAILGIVVVIAAMSRREQQQ